MPVHPAIMQTVHLIQFGIGNVGKALIRKILDYNKQSQQSQIKCLGIANSSSFIFNNLGMDDESLSKIISTPKSQSLNQLPGTINHNGDLKMVIDTIEKDNLYFATGTN